MKDTIQNHFKGNWYGFYSKYLLGVKKIGGQEFQALCPFHEDSNPSFNFNNETGAYSCHGCGKKGAGLHFYARTHDLNDRRDFPKVLKGIASDFGIPWEQEQKRIVKTYDYTDANGKLVHQTIREEAMRNKLRRLAVWLLPWAELLLVRGKFSRRRSLWLDRLIVRSEK